MSASGFKGMKRRAPGSVHSVLADAFHQAGGVEAAAAMLPGRSSKRLYDAANPDADIRHQVALTYDEVRALTFAGGVTAFAEDLAHAAGGVFLPPFDPAHGEVARLAALLGQENGEALAKLFTSLGDGELSPREAREALPEVRDVIRAVVALYSQLCATAGVAPGAACVQTEER